MKKSGPDLNPWKYAGIAGVIGMDLVFCILIGYFGGMYMSNRTGHTGWMAGGVLVGLFVGLVSIVLIVKRFLEEMNE